MRMSAGLSSNTVAHKFWNYFVAFLALLGFVAPAVGQPSYSIRVLGLTGNGYTYPAAGGIGQNSSLWGLNETGRAVGESVRYNAAGTTLGYDSWYFDGTSIEEIGLTGGEYGYSKPQGIYEAVGVMQLNSQGEAIGSSNAYDSTGAIDLGAAAWLFNGAATVQLGFTGGVYAYLNGSGVLAASQATQLNDSGQVIGRTDRWSSNGTGLGADAWLYSGGSLTQLGLTGGVYSPTTSNGIYEFSQPIEINNSGQVIGESFRATASGATLGADAWISNGTTTRVLGLTGTDYVDTTPSGVDEDSSPVRINDNGEVVGGTARVGPSAAGGNDAWLFNGSATQLIGLIDGDYAYAVSGKLFRNVSAQQLNDAGQVTGISNRYSPTGVALGQDAWIFDGATTNLIGLTGSADSSTTSNGVIRYSFLTQLNQAGQVIGTTNRYGNREIYGGVDAWIFDGTTTREIGLTGGVYSVTSGSQTLQTSNPVQINAKGNVIGYSWRYDSSGNSLGQDGFFFNDTTDTTIPLEFSVNSTTNESDTYPQYLTDNNVVLGSYILFNGSTDLGSRAFYWSPTDGFHDLGALVDPTLSAEQWQYLADTSGNYFQNGLGLTPDGSPEFIVGDGLISGQTTGYSVYLLSADQLPEPASAGVLITLLTVVAPLARGGRRRNSLHRKYTLD